MYIGIDGCELIDPWMADILYGSGPWILLDNAVGISMTMIPFRNGQTYRGITLEQSGWMCSPVRVANPEAQYTYTLDVGETGKKVVIPVQPKTWFYEESYQYAHDIEYWWSFHAIVTIGVTPIVVEVIPATQITAKITIGQPYETPDQTYYITVIIPPQYVWCNIIDIDVQVMIDIGWHIASCYKYVVPPGEWVDNTAFCNFVSIGESLVAFFHEHITIVHLHHHPADIAGGAAGIPYYYADGICSIKDATLIGLYWMQVVPPSTDPTSNLARADINGDGIVSIKDATQVGLYWMQTWP